MPRKIRREQTLPIIKLTLNSNLAEVAKNSMGNFIADGLHKIVLARLGKAEVVIYYVENKHKMWQNDAGEFIIGRHSFPFMKLKEAAYVQGIFGKVAFLLAEKFDQDTRYVFSSYFTKYTFGIFSGKVQYHRTGTQKMGVFRKRFIKSSTLLTMDEGTIATFKVDVGESAAWMVYYEDADLGDACFSARTDSEFRDQSPVQNRALSASEIRRMLNKILALYNND